MPNLTKQIAETGNCFQQPRGAKQPRKRIPRVSPRRAAQLKEYTVLRREFLIAHPTCQHPGCMSASRDVHHKKGRIGELLTNKRHFLAVCRPHHRHIHDHPSEARHNGLLA